jgi:hypothetical protein
MVNQVIPIAPKDYAQRDEQIFRDIIRQALAKCLGIDQIPQFAGVPAIVAKGTTNPLNIPNGVTHVLLPFDTLISEWGELTYVLPVVTTPYTMTIQVDYKIRHLAAGGASTPIIIAVYLYKNGVLHDQHLFQVFENLLFDQLGTFYTTAVAGDDFDIRFNHGHSSTIQLNMALSTVAYTQMTPNPVHIDRARL